VLVENADVAKAKGHSKKKKPNKVIADAGSSETHRNEKASHPLQATREPRRATVVR
jgi:hypothetical protein